MRVISPKRLKAFWAVHADAKPSLKAWLDVAKACTWNSFTHLRKTLPAADQVGRFTVFNIAGNKYRMISVIHFNRNRIYIRHVLTHAEYDKGTWKKG